MRTPGRVLLHRADAAFWVVLGAVSFPIGWANSVVLVWIASVYANVKSGWSAAEAADNREVLAELRRVCERLERIEASLAGRSGDVKDRHATMDHTDMGASPQR